MELIFRHYKTLITGSSLAAWMGDNVLSDTCLERATELQLAINAHCWDATVGLLINSSICRSLGKTNPLVYLSIIYGDSVFWESNFTLSLRCVHTKSPDSLYKVSRLIEKPLNAEPILNNLFIAIYAVLLRLDNQG